MELILHIKGDLKEIFKEYQLLKEKYESVEFYTSFNAFIAESIVPQRLGTMGYKEHIPELILELATEAVLEFLDSYPSQVFNFDEIDDEIKQALEASESDE